MFVHNVSTYIRRSTMLNVYELCIQLSMYIVYITLVNFVTFNKSFEFNLNNFRTANKINLALWVQYALCGLSILLIRYSSGVNFSVC